MGGEWRAIKWGDIATLAYGKALSGYSDTKGSARVYGTNGPIGWHSEARWDGPGVIVGRKGAYRGVHYTSDPYWVIDTAYSLRPKANLNLRWAYYQLKHLDVNNIDDGSPIPSTTRDAFYVQDLLLPPREEQDRIASLLASLDDKIELNRRMGATLEEMARALFKSWFVDFDPVRAKAEGRDPGLPPATAALFPDKFGADGFPSGWNGTAENIGKSIRELVQPSRIDPNTPYVGLEHFEKKNLALAAMGVAEEVDSKKAVFKRGDLLFGKLRPYFHKVAVAPMDGICSTDILVFRPQEGIPSTYLYLAFSAAGFVAKASGAQEGTRMPRADWGFMRKLPVPKPNTEVLTAFDDAVAPLIDRLLATVAQSQSLAALRDTLLPKLISGELRIKDSGKDVEAA
ncbi:MAG: restriction endonuclease subunit S [Tabrizicola sp.]|jgi:type I restriction enzyme S subunit|nr:restriction endonuclease subunit S [Tabrizicola sp.]